MSTHFHVPGQDVYLLSALATLPLLVLAFFLRPPRSEARADNHIWRECTNPRSSNWALTMPRQDVTLST